ncbi:MAG: hypothetical protein J6E44_11380 [Lachnospiraceae bacterium]|nr:hypothetical protein [Lachnospiraceae bacterium]
MKTIAFILSVIVVFSTTYSMILPAITLSDSAAEEEPGIFFEDTEELTAGEETEFTYEEEYTEEFPEEPETEPEADVEPDPEWDYEYEEEAEEWDSDPGETEEVDDLALEGAEENLYEAEDAVTTEDGADDQPEAGQTEVQTEPASQGDAESVTVSPEVYEEFLTSEQSAQDGRYLIVRITDDGRYVAMNRDGAVVPVDYNADDNTASCDDENQELVWVKSGNSLHTPDDERYVRLTDESVGFSVVFDEPSSVSIEKPDDHQYAGAVYRTVVTDGVPEYYALVLSEDQTYFTAVAIDTKPVKRTILAKEAPSDPNESETESDDEPVLEEASLDAESAWETVSSEVESAVEMTVSEVDSVAEGVESEVDSVAEGVFSDAESAAEEVLTVYESGERTIQVEGADYTIHISWPAEAMIPENAVFTAVSLDQKKGYETYKEEALNVAAGEDSDARKRSSALGVFDLTITDAAGAVIEPSAPVSVSVDFGESLDPETSVLAVHFPGTGEQPEEDDGIEYDEVKINVDASTAAAIDAVNEDGAVSFEADSFSVYVIVGTVIEKNVLASDGKNYRISVTYGAETGIPVDADLSVEEILPEENGDANMFSAYEEYVSKTENVLGMEEGSAGYIRLFDIKIVDKDDLDIKYQPAQGTSVDVRIELADKDSSEDAAASTQVVHFHNEEMHGTIIENSTDGQIVAFKADGFSIYAIIDSSKRLQYNFYDGTSLLVSEYIKKQDNIIQELYDPGVEPEYGQTFVGWAYAPDETNPSNIYTIEELNQQAAARYNSATEELTEINVYAIYDEAWYLRYMDEDAEGNEVVLNVVRVRKDAANKNVIINYTFTPEEGIVFEGWMDVTTGQTYQQGDTITLDHHVDLYVKP